MRATKLGARAVTELSGDRKSASASASSSGSVSASASAASHEETDVFEIEDFTCATAWERFIASIETQFRDWGVGVARNHHSIKPATATTSAAAGKRPAPKVTAASSNRSCTLTYQNRDFALEYFWIPIDIPTANATPQPATTNSAATAAATAVAGSGSGSGGGPTPSALSSDEKEKLSLSTHTSRLSDHTLPAHHLSRWFGCSQFIRLMPAPVDRVVSPDEALEALSALTIASSAVACNVPLFVAVHETWKHTYVGRMISATGSGDVWFDVRISDDAPPALRHLSGLTDYFTDHVLTPNSAAESKATASDVKTLIAASYTYTQTSEDWGYDEENDVDGTWRDVSHDSDISFGAFWGPTLDPIAALRLTASWPYFPEGTFVDNAVYSDLDPLLAPNWIVGVEWTRDDHFLDTPLSTAIKAFITAAQTGVKVSALTTISGAETSSNSDVKRAAAAAPASSTKPATAPPATSASTSGKASSAAADSKDASAANGLLAVRALETIKASIESTALTVSHGLVPSAEYIDNAMKDIFDVNSAAAPSSAAGSSADSKKQSPNKAKTKIVLAPTTNPIAATKPSTHGGVVPYGSLLSRFLFKVLNTHSDRRLSIRTVAVMWSEFVQELRFHYESALPLPHLLSDDTPDFSFCLLHQKLQLLQRCIRLHHAATAAASGKSGAGGSNSATANLDRKHTAGGGAGRGSAPELVSEPGSKTEFDWDKWNAIIDAGAATTPASGASAASNSGWGDSDLNVDLPPETKSESKSATATAAGAGAKPASVTGAASAAWDFDFDVDESPVKPKSKAAAIDASGIAAASKRVSAAIRDGVTTLTPDEDIELDDTTTSPASAAAASTRSASASASASRDSKSSDDEADAFVDSNEAPTPKTAPTATAAPTVAAAAAAPAPVVTAPAYTGPPLGVQSQHLSLRLLHKPDTALNVPITQPQPVATSDMIDEQRELFTRLGTGADAQRIRAEIQGASLLSDMQAFKAANPGCCFEDFVRWHSPNDWQSQPSGAAALSQRMRNPNNLWQLLWSGAAAVPASDQKPLFDHTIEAERVLNDLANVEPRHLFAQCALIAFGCGIGAMHRTDGPVAGLEMCKTRLTALESTLKTAAKQYYHTYQSATPPAAPFTLKPELCDDLIKLELACARATSLLYKLPFSIRLANQILRIGCAVVKTRQERSDIHALFANGQDSAGQASLPKPDVAEFTLLRPAASPTLSNSGAAATFFGDRLYARITAKEFRIGTARRLPY